MNAIMAKPASMKLPPSQSLVTPKISRGLFIALAVGLPIAYSPKSQVAIALAPPSRKHPTPTFSMVSAMRPEPKM